MTGEEIGWGLVRDVLRHDFKERELRVLLQILARGRGARVLMDRKEFEGLLDLRSDKVLLVLRGLQRARVLMKGWEEGEFAIEPNAEAWRVPERAPAGLCTQGPLGMESAEAGVRFEQEVAAAGLAARATERAAGVLPGPADARGVCCSNAIPQIGENLRRMVSGASSPQFGETSIGGPLDGGLAAFPNLGSVPGKVPVPTYRTSLSALMARVATQIQDEEWRRWGQAWQKAALGHEEALERALEYSAREITADWSGTRRGKYVWKVFKCFMQSPKNLQEALDFSATAGVAPEITRIWFDERESMGWEKGGFPIQVWQRDLAAYAAKWKANVHEREMRYEKRRSHTDSRPGRKSDPNRDFSSGASDRTRAALEEFRRRCASGGNAA